MSQWKADLAFLDESGFFLTPTVRRTLASRGKTPVLEAWDWRDKWSAIRCVTVSPVVGRPGLYFYLLGHNVHGEGVVTFLALPGGAAPAAGPGDGPLGPDNIHSKAKVVKAWLAGHPDVAVEDFPGYVPDLNTDEGCGGGSSTPGCRILRSMTRMYSGIMRSTR